MSNDSRDLEDFFKELDAEEKDILSELEQQRLLEEKNNGQVYKNFAKFFFFGGLAALLVALAEKLFQFRFFNGEIYGIAVFLMIIGVLMWRS